ncbi:hypothetical protein VSS74_24600 [Conexibacter stalactiti]|uniref:Mce-associated membrane protein n=1 Tax=Conexibacter stalactiti TaxID=1940611 RepID=A0ABU4HWF2_9ACTN|nr:hypothetical protein [Conexibacter stalactiti]MDW5597553.1 hypothetical protein [Conexibacter stalactiti]MEC5038195.1 hypothetical protein [Conexibacter stalactiti]
MRPARQAPALAALLAAVLAGCGIENPYDERRPTANAGAVSGEPVATQPADFPIGGELRPGRPAAGEPTTFPAAGRTPQSTLRMAALLAGNWTAATAQSVYDKLAAISVSDTRVQFQQLAAGARIDVRQRGEGARSTATVVAITVSGTGDTRRGVIVTRERMVTDDLPSLAAEYRVTLARVQRRGGAWVIASWEPKP